MYCENCGKRLQDGAVFCSNCGHKVDTANDIPKQEVPVQAPQWEDEIRQVSSPKQGRASGSGKKPPKKGKTKLYVLGGVAVLLLTVVVTAASGVLVYKAKLKEADKIVQEEQIEAKNEEKSDIKAEDAKEAVIENEGASEDKNAEKEAGEKKEENKETEKETVDMETTEKKKEGPTIIGGTLTERTPVKKKPSKKKPSKKKEKAPTEVQKEAPAEDPGFKIEKSEVQVYNEGAAGAAVHENVESEYVIENSDRVYLTESDLAHLTLQQLNYAKNEIYARHGRKFYSNELQNYFNGKSWYHGTIDPSAFPENLLSQCERANADLLAKVEFSINPKGYQLDQ